MEENIEIWKDIKGYEELYQISNYGNVKSLNYRRSGKEKILKPSKNNDGYLFVVLHKNNIRNYCLVHRLVAKCFLEPIEGKDIINHKDENPLNNRVENLEWVTQKENLNYGTHNERISKTKSIPIIQLDLQGNFMFFWDSAKTASKKLNINQGNIIQCCRKKRKTCGGYKWCYKETSI